MTKEQIDELAKDYAAEWYIRYEDMGVGMDQAWWILPLVAKSMVKAYKKGYYAAKQKYNKPTKRNHNDKERKARPYKVYEERN